MAKSSIKIGIKAASSSSAAAAQVNNAGQHEAAAS